MTVALTDTLFWFPTEQRTMLCNAIEVAITRPERRTMFKRHCGNHDIGQGDTAEATAYQLFAPMDNTRPETLLGLHRHHREGGKQTLGVLSMALTDKRKNFRLNHTRRQCESLGYHRMHTCTVTVVGMAQDIDPNRRVHQHAIDFHSESLTDVPGGRSD